MAIQSLCSIAGCDKPVLARGWCGTHYQRWSLHGDALWLPEQRNKPLRWLEEHSESEGDDCLIYPFGKTGMGYGVVYPSGEQQVMAHRWMCERAHGPAPDGKVWVAHSCANGHLACVNPRHIRWATPKENGEDRVAHGHAPRGVGHRNSKLTEAQALAIWKTRGQTTPALAGEPFGVTSGCVSAIWRRRTWRWLTDQLAA